MINGFPQHWHIANAIKTTFGGGGVEWTSDVSSRAILIQYECDVVVTNNKIYIKAKAGDGIRHRIVDQIDLSDYDCIDKIKATVYKYPVTKPNIMPGIIATIAVLLLTSAVVAFIELVS